MKNFGENRVIEPKGSLPVTAWKLDNSRKLKDGEVRIAIDYISVERDSMCQLCSISEHNDDKVIGRIMKLVSERGKLHNPYTNSGAVCSGVIEEISPNCKRDDIKVGDKVICLSTMTGIPLYIQEIEDINFDFAQVKCKGYAIAFETTLLQLCDFIPENRNKYFRRALDKEGAFHGIASQIKDIDPKKVLIIGASLVEIAFFSQLIKNMIPNAEINLLIENGCTCTSCMKENVIMELLNPLIDHLYFNSMSNPIDAAKSILGPEENNLMDVVLNVENIKNSESLAAIMVKSGGLICHSYVYNNLAETLLITESLGKKGVKLFSLDSVNDNGYDIALKLLHDVEPVLKKLDQYFDNTNKHIQRRFKQAKDIGQMVAKQVDGFIYMSSVTEELVAEALNIAKYDCNVIIQGETGVGKERVFDLIQQNSSRNSQPCVKVNCATIQENLAESEFFGYEKGSFTGASSTGKEGYFELANNGTLFLDEIGTLPLSMQSKLLRVLQENTFYRVGGTKPKHVDVRVICANNIPLKKMVEEGEFREDLYYRLNICQIEIPPLRMRKDDIYCLAEEFIKKYSNKYGIEKTFSLEAYEVLEEYGWPGNVRELENAVHRLYICEKDSTITAAVVDDLLNENAYDNSIIDIRKEFKQSDYLDFNSIMERQEKKLIEYALKREGTTRKAAEILNIPQATLARKKTKYNL